MNKNRLNIDSVACSGAFNLPILPYWAVVLVGVKINGLGLVSSLSRKVITSALRLLGDASTKAKPSS